MTSPKPRCFVISPIGSEGSSTRTAADQVLKHIIRKALGDDYDVQRGDEDSNPGSITAQIIESILEADLVVADLSGFNPNVYYEVAIAHGYARPTVHLQVASETPAFDLKDMRLITYDLTDLDSVEAAGEQLKRLAEFLMETPEKAKTPLSQAQRFAQIADSADPVAQGIAQLTLEVRELRTETRRQTRTIRSTPSNRDAMAGVRKVVERASERGALIKDDFVSIITNNTTGSFDDWARRMLSQNTGLTRTNALNGILYEPELLGTPELEFDSVPDTEEDSEA